MVFLELIFWSRNLKKLELIERKVIKKETHRGSVSTNWGRRDHKEEKKIREEDDM